MLAGELIAASAFAQARQSSTGIAIVADSSRISRTAERAQRAFEATRRNHLPFDRGASSYSCDVRVGRFCYWHDDRYTPREEPEAIGRARSRLLATLDSAAALLPGDEWIVGQRVRYRLEAKDGANALEAATSCRASLWWCSALAGLALHLEGRYASADSAFGRALAEMTPADRCRWTDVELFLDGDARDAFKRARCIDSTAGARRDSIAERLWWLAQPFHSLSANDRRTEHFARRTMSHLERMAQAGYDSRWGPDTDELLMRFGWPTTWTRLEPASLMSLGPGAIVGHEPTPSYRFLPKPHLLFANIAKIRNDSWEPTLHAAPERYAPSYLKGWSSVTSHVGVFRRGQMALVVAGWRAADDTLLHDDSLVASLAVSHGPRDIAVKRMTGAREGTLYVTTPWSDAIASVELLAPTRRAGARMRHGIAMPASSGRVALSDLLFYSPPAIAPTSLDDALPHVLRESRIHDDRRVGVLWETYGLSPNGETLDVSLVVERIRAGWTTRAAERLRLATRARPVRVRWEESPDRKLGAAFRALAVDLSHLASGHYRVRLEVAAPDGARAAAERELEIR
jgi:hypothetical protein